MTRTHTEWNFFKEILKKAKSVKEQDLTLKELEDRISLYRAWSTAR